MEHLHFLSLEVGDYTDETHNEGKQKLALVETLKSWRTLTFLKNGRRGMNATLFLVLFKEGAKKTVSVSTYLEGKRTKLTNAARDHQGLNQPSF